MCYLDDSNTIFDKNNKGDCNYDIAIKGLILFGRELNKTGLIIYCCHTRNGEVSIYVI